MAPVLVSDRPESMNRSPVVQQQTESAASSEIKSAAQLIRCGSLAMQMRERHTKHWRPEFKKLRRMKVATVKIPNFNEDQDTSKLSTEEIKSRMKERGIKPPRSWVEKPTFISCTGSIFEAYIPPEGDGKMSSVTLSGAKQSLELLSKKSKSMLAVRKIRSYDEDFDPRDFAQVAQDVYVKAHTALAEKNMDVVHDCVTEQSYPLMTDGLRFSTLRWQFIKSLEPPRVVHARCTDVVTKENVFAQVTVRFHTQQTLAIYDRFGRLIHGSEIVAKDVLEYVVFEKHIANQYGKWRIHEKIIPDWMPPPAVGMRTYVKKMPVSDSVSTKLTPASSNSV
nr:EOG090X0DDP [Leptodora kindtii]